MDLMEHHSSLPLSSMFDFIPVVHAILSRLLLEPTDKDTIQPKDLAVEISQTKQRVQRACVVMEQLPDMNRTIMDQELEIRNLEAKIAKQKQQLGGIAEQVKELT